MYVAGVWGNFELKFFVFFHVNLRHSRIFSWSYFFYKLGSNESFRLMWQHNLLVLSNHIGIQANMMDLQPEHVYKILFRREGKVVPNSSLKFSEHHCSNDGKGGILETSNCLSPLSSDIYYKISAMWKKKHNQLSVSKGNAETEVTFPSAWKASCRSSIFRYYRSAAHAAVTHWYRTTLFSSFLREVTVWRWKGHSLFQVCLKCCFLERIKNTQCMVQTHLGLRLFGNLCVTAEGPCWFIQSHFVPWSFSWQMQHRMSLMVCCQPHGR